MKRTAQQSATLGVCTAALVVSAGAIASAQTVTSVSGAVSSGQTITINGTSFGANGPSIVIQDDFESGAVGTKIDTHNGLVGVWANDNDPSPPRYDNVYSHSGNQAMKSDFQIASGSSIQANISPATSDAFVSWWFMMPTTSQFPGYDTGIAIWKVSWLMGIDANHTDQMLPESSNTTAPFRGWYIGCNDCAGGDGPYFGEAGTSDMSMYKGRWYRIWAWIHATNDSSGHKDVWFMSTDSGVPVTRGINKSGPVMNGSGPYFQQWLLGAYGRSSSVETQPRFDDAYLAVGPNARARVEIGNASTYNACTNLALQTVRSWSNTQLTVTVRPESFGGSIGSQYLYVIDSAGRVSNGFRLGGASAPAAPTNLRIVGALTPLPLAFLFIAVRRLRSNRPAE